MATSNRDRIGQLFDILSPHVEAFLYRHVPRTQEANDWVRIYEEVHGGQVDDINPGDASVQLKFLSEGYTNRYRRGWRPLAKHFSRLQEAWAGELLQVRHSWAHQKPFSDDDAYRALDTGERFARAIGAGEAADEIAAIRLNLRRVTAEKDDQRTLKKVASANPDSSGLRPWREVLKPHEDVATGNFQAAEFAADLYKVATRSGDLGKDYADPVEFFRRTYLTEGLKDLIGRAVRRLSGDDNASPVVNLQTNFGGGKTHSMLALWHLAGGTPVGRFPQETQDLLVASGFDNVVGVHRVALVGQHLPPTGLDHPVDGGSIHVNTMWGELAWQLGGAEAYAMVADADRSGTNPGGALHELLSAYSPAVILIDEWVAYARQLPDELSGETRVAGGTFDTQFTFAQSLTEAAAATSGILLAISIPASETGTDPNDDSTPVAGNLEEVGGARGVEAVQRLQNVVRRVADQWRPASANEAYHIVRQRLFVNPEAAELAAIGATARAFGDFYRKHADDFPREARDPAYEDRIRHTYPIHPELFDCLYEDWSSLPRFQRTRGVLRLMNQIIHALWVGDDPSPLIMPGTIPLSTSAVNSEFVQYLADAWKPIIDADVDGPNSEPARIDTERTVFGQRGLTKRLARTVFFGAAPTIGSAQKGIETRRVFLGTATPGDVTGNFQAALTALGDRATYFYSGQGKYWYDLQANISRRAKDQAERMHPEDVWAEIAARLAVQQRHRGDFAAVQVCPEDSADIPDVDEVRLVVLHPRLTHARRSTVTSAYEFAQRATEHRGTAHRTYRNMLVFLAPDLDRMAELDVAVRDYLAWKGVLESHDVDLTGNQRSQAEEKKAQADSTASARLLGTYIWALVPEQPDGAHPFRIGELKIEGSAEWLADRVSRRLGSDGRLNVVQAATPVRLAIQRAPRIWGDGHVSVGDLWRFYAEYPYMPRLRDRAVLATGVRQQPLLWQQDGFALADGYADGRYVGLVAGHGELAIAVTDATLVVRPEVAEAQLEAESRPIHDAPDAAVDQPTDPVQPRDRYVETSPGVHTVVPAKTRFFGVKELSADRYAVDFRKVVDEVLAHLGDPSVALTLRLEVEATSPQGFSDATIRTVSENATTLRFEQSGFEEE